MQQRYVAGTGVVTSVPSDSPDDYTALRDVKNKKVSVWHRNVSVPFILQLYFSSPR